MKRAGILSCVVSAMLMALCATATAAAPTVTTGPATGVGANSATLTGTVSPGQEPTTYRFEYGTSTAYGASTPDQGPVNGNADKAASAAITGLAPSTVYHYRLVATNGSGTVAGSDVTFTTPAAGQQTDGVTIKASPQRITFGGATAISGGVTGKGASGASVELEQSPFPFTSAFAPMATVTADQAGRYRFANVRPAVNTRYQATAKTSPPATSPIVTVLVRPVVTLRLNDRTPARGQRVRFGGRVVPGHDGKVVRIQRHTRTGWRTISTPTLKPMSAANGVPRSRYSRRLKVRRSATYRTVFLPGDGDHVRGTSAKRSARVH
jgi:hypothetical protein